MFFKKYWPDFLILLFLLTLILLFFLPFLTFQNIPYAGDFTGSDLTELNLPFRWLLTESLNQGQIPLWTDLIANGFPILAEGQAGIFYPFNLFFYRFFSFSTALNLGLILNFWLAGFFIYLYCREIGISRLGGLLAAVSFSFSGWFVFRLKHLNLINASIWLPLVFFLIEKYFKTKNKPLMIIALSLVFAIQFFAGFPQIFYLSIISATLYFVFKLFFEEKEKNYFIFLKKFMPWLAVGIIILGLIAIQALPTYEYSKLTSRGQVMDYSQIRAYPYPASSLIYFILPYFWGNPAFASFPVNLQIFGIFWENNIYFGILSLIFAFLAIFFLSSKNKNAKILTLLFFISFIFIFGDFSPLFIIFWKIIPGLQTFRFPQRFLLLSLTCSSVLAAFGFDFLWQKIKDWQERKDKFLKSKLLFKKLLPVAIILIVAVDLFLVGFKYVGILDYDKYFSTPESAKFLQADQDNFRIYVYNWPETWYSVYNISEGWQNNLSLFIAGRELIPPNLNALWNIASIDDRASLEGGLLAKEVHNLRNLLINDFKVDESDKSQTLVSDKALKILGLQNVKYILSQKELKNDNLNLVKEIKIDFLPPVKIYQNKEFLPFAFGIFEAKTATSTQAMLEMMFDQKFNPAKQITLPKEAPLWQDNNSYSQADINVEKGNFDENFSIKVNFNQDGYLFLSQTFYPGWQAKIDSLPTQIFRADYAFSAVKVPAGEHRITFSFEPNAYIIGKWITFVTIIILILYLIFYFIIKRRVLK